MMLGAMHYEIFRTQFSCSIRLWRIHNYMIIHNVIHFEHYGSLSSLQSKMLNMLVKWDEACFVAFVTDCICGIIYDNLVLPLFSTLLSPG